MQKADGELEEMQLQKAELLQQIQSLVTNKDGPRVPKDKILEPSSEDIEAWNELMQPTPQRKPTSSGAEDDRVLRQALQAAQDPEAFLQLTLAELAAAPTSMEVDHAPDPPPAPAPRIIQMATPPRPTGVPPTPIPQRAEDQAEAKSLNSSTLDAELYHYKEAMRVGRDPYMTSPSLVGEVGQTSPVQDPPHFGPMRTPKTRELAKEAASRLAQQVIGPTIIHDDDDVADVASSNGSQFSVME